MVNLYVYTSKWFMNESGFYIVHITTDVLFNNNCS